ncbi:MAG: arsenate reductase (glutaredoxin) [Paracoccus sp. (in: a-proteobacteria)]|nr:arsenate reductase (glutaredoxin) [Paracoccus sp. (in: a-proteobacteria)]
MGNPVIWHKQSCSTSRWVLGVLRDAGLAPVIRDYIAAPPGEDELRQVLARLDLSARGLIRRKETLFAEMGLGDPSLSEDALIAAMSAHPVLIERPVVLAAHGAILCRPKELVFRLFPDAVKV